MPVIYGVVIVVFCVLGGYAAMGGKLYVLFQPFEAVIIVGAAVGAYLISNPPIVVRKTGAAFLSLLKPSSYTKEAYVELLRLQYQIFKLMRTQGMLSLEEHIENPKQSSLFRQFPRFYANKAAITFFCDYLRLIALGSNKAFELSALMDEELETHHAEHTRVANALQTVADGIPALGIVAAVLGVIKTMSAITEPPEVLGRLIGGALVGTFLGVWLSYGFVGPIAQALKARSEAELKYFQCIRAGILAHLAGSAPAISIEFARKTIFSEVRPTFYEVENATSLIPSSTMVN